MVYWLDQTNLRTVSRMRVGALQRKHRRRCGQLTFMQCLHVQLCATPSSGKVTRRCFLASGSGHLVPCQVQVVVRCGAREQVCVLWIRSMAITKRRGGGSVCWVADGEAYRPDREP